MFQILRAWRIATLFSVPMLTLAVSALADTPAAATHALAGSAAVADASRIAVAPDWMIGTFVPARTAFGQDPDGYCLLTVTPKQLIVPERPGDSPRVLTYQIVVSNPEFIIAEVEDDKNGKNNCLHGLKHRPTAYFRFDHEDFFKCVSEKDLSDDAAEKACPKPFTGPAPQSLDLTIYSDLDAAQHVARSERTKGAVMSWSGYWKKSN